MSDQAQQKHFFGKASSQTLGTGLVLLFTSIGLVVLASDNFLAIGLGWFTFLIGIMLVMMGTLGGQTLKKPDQQVTREIIKVRCSHCGALTWETNNKCPECGANL